jgi:crotonobetainyl-CoA:carnitine CoA-transferase CaiB-like acyl-CoA transferase
VKVTGIEKEAPIAGWQPLQDVRVLDLSALLPGPFATLALADLGADVVKVEPLSGDFARRMPSSLFTMANRNKRSLAIDLKRPDSAEVMRRLAGWADVAIEGFRPGVVDRLGVGAAALQAANPRLIYCSLSGYGQSGPDAQVPGHDLNYLCAGGAMTLSGHWGEAPRRSAIPVADLAGGAYAVIAILSALHERQTTGRGRRLDLSLTEAAMSFVSIRHGLDLDARSQEHVWPTNDLFETADGGYVALGIVEEHFWRAFVEAVGDLAPDLLSERYSDEPQRRRHGDELIARLREVMRMRPTSEWLEKLRGAGAPAQRAMSPAEASRREQIAARHMVMRLDGERHIPFPVMVDGERGAALRNIAPPLGAHTREVLREIGFADLEIDAFRRTGAIATAS